MLRVTLCMKTSTQGHIPNLPSKNALFLWWYLGLAIAQKNISLEISRFDFTWRWGAVSFGDSENLFCEVIICSHFSSMISSKDILSLLLMVQTKEKQFLALSIEFSGVGAGRIEPPQLTKTPFFLHYTVSQQVQKTHLIGFHTFFSYVECFLPLPSEFPPYLSWGTQIYQFFAGYLVCFCRFLQR